MASLVIDPQRAERFERPAPRLEWAMGGLVAQLAVIYFFNWVHKDTEGWAEGRVVHDVLHQDRIVTAFGVWARQFVTPTVSSTLTQLTLLIEGLLPVALLWPGLTVRRVAVVTGLALHFGFALAMNLGVFSFVMMCAWFFVLPPGDLERLLSQFRRSREVTISFDSRSGWFRWLAKALLVLQRTSVVPVHLELRASKHREGFVIDGRRLTWLEKLSHVEMFFGLGVDTPFPPIVRARRWAEAAQRTFGRGAILFVAVVFVVQVLAQNRAVPETIKPTPPFWVDWFVSYTHFLQGWGMFAVSPNTDATVVVRARTVDGRLVDPLSERASPRSPPAIDAISDRLDHDEFFCDYLSRIADEPAYHPPLRDWLLAYPTRSGNPNDRLASFEVIQVTDRTPPLGQAEPFDQRQRVVMRWP